MMREFPLSPTRLVPAATRASLALLFQLGSFPAPVAVAQGQACTLDWQVTFAGPGGSSQLDGNVFDLIMHDDGSGQALYAAGSFQFAGSLALNYVGKWNGSSWEALGSGFNAEARALCTFDDGTGEALYVLGEFTSAGGSPAPGIAKWNGSQWSNVGAGLNPAAWVDHMDLIVFDDGSGPTLVACGHFHTSSYLRPLVMRWDGSQWSELGGFFSEYYYPKVGTALASWDDGSGAGHQLYMAVYDIQLPWDNKVFKFGQYGCGAASSPSWCAVPTTGPFDDLNTSPYGTVLTSLAAVDAGSPGGPALYVAGLFDRIRNDPNQRVFRSIAKFDGTTYSAVGPGLPGNLVETLALRTLTPGSAPTLYAGGIFDAPFTSTQGGVVTQSPPPLAPRSGLAAWDGLNWVVLGSDLSIPSPSGNHADNGVECMAFADGSSGQELIVGGVFETISTGITDRSITRLACVPLPEFTESCFGNGGDGGACTACPCANNAFPSSHGGCRNNSGNSARLLGSGAASLTADTLRMELTGGNPSTYGRLISADHLAPANPSNPCFGLNTGLQSLNLDGLRCAVGNFQRHGTRPMDTNGDIGVTTNGWGPPDGPTDGLIAQGGFTAGQTRHFQVVYRDEATLGCMTGRNTSQAVSVTFQP